MERRNHKIYVNDRAYQGPDTDSKINFMEEVHIEKLITTDKI